MEPQLNRVVCREELNCLAMPAREPLITTFRSLHGRIGIFGGTFDPPHIGHIEAARAALIQHRLDAIVFIPAGQNPLKKNGPTAAPAQRLEMLKLMLRSEPGMFVSAVEFDRPAPSYTVDTVKSIRSQLPAQAELFFIAGGDNFATLHKWKDCSELLSLVKFIPITRRGERGLDLQVSPLLSEATRDELVAATVALDVDVSSTNIRAELVRGRMPAAGLTEEVKEYIRQKGLYGYAGTETPCV